MRRRGTWLLGLVALCWTVAADAQACEHDLCEEGVALASSCDACVHSICVADAFCCDPVLGAWDSFCVEKVMTVCHEPRCEAACEHGLCSAGEPLTASCNSCAAKICDEDPLCCSNQWDATCIAKVETECFRTSCVQGADQCTAAVVIDNNQSRRMLGTLEGMGANGCSSLEGSCNSADTWYEYTVPDDGKIRYVSTCGTEYSFGIDTLISVHSQCPGNPGTEVTANDDWMFGPAPSACNGSLPRRFLDAATPFPYLVAGLTYKVRLTHFVDSAASDYQIYVPEPSAALLRCVGLATLVGLSRWRLRRRPQGRRGEPS